jgi:hypothetical protein
MGKFGIQAAYPQFKINKMIANGSTKDYLNAKDLDRKLMIFFNR